MAEFINAATDTDDTGKTNTGCCPLCRQPNSCVMAKDEYVQPTECWCMHLVEKIPDELLDMIPSEQRGEACICQACIQRFWAGEMP